MFILSCLVFLVAFSPVFALAGPPTETVRQTVQQVTRLLDDVEMRKPERLVERRDRLERIVMDAFSYEEMAKRTLGAQWHKLDAEQQREFVQLLRRLLVNTYGSRIEAYRGEAFEYLSERIEDGHAEVRTKMTSKIVLQLDYRMVNVNGRWWVYDIVIDGISLVQNYRSQFTRILRSSSYHTLLETLRNKVRQFQEPRITVEGVEAANRP